MKRTAIACIVFLAAALVCAWLRHDLRTVRELLFTYFGLAALVLPRPYYQDRSVTLYNADCKDIVPLLPRCDLLFTSPPYAQQRDYGTPITDWDGLMHGAFKGLRCHAETQLLVNLGLVHRKDRVLEYWQDWMDWMQINWRLFGWYVWDKGFGLPGEFHGRLSPAHEFIFHFNKRTRLVNKIVPCIHAGEKGGGALRQKDGTMKGWSRRPVQKLKIPDSVIRVHPQLAHNGPEREHPAVFPVSFAEVFIAAFSDRGGLVLDPFAGSGTTLVAAKKLKRRAIGIELEKKYCKIAALRLEGVT